MNDRIKELAYQTKLKTGALPGTEEWQTVFAELIVRECIDTVKKDSVVTLEDKIGLILSIKEQFGVKL